MWNLGNEPDLFAEPPTWQAGQEWVRTMTGVIHAIDTQHPVTCGLHQASVFRDNGFRIDKVYAETDRAVMHSYPMYVDMARQPLDPDYVPYTCALTSALCGKPTLMEEFGGCTVAPGEPSAIWRWEQMGRAKTQFMASEEALAEFLRQTLPRLQTVGALGAIVWCFADYAEALWDKPPCDEQRHERFFGLVRPDGSLKPHAQVLKDFAATNPTVQPLRPDLIPALDPDDFYRAPAATTKKLYPQFCEKMQP
jgi:endo-1,4-beta-mannosidase